MREDALRLPLALALSSAVHLSLIYGIAVGQPKPNPASIIKARLLPKTAEQPAGPAAAVTGRRGSNAAAGIALRTAQPAVTALVDASAESPVEPVALASAHLDDSHLPSADLPLLVDPAWYEAKDLDLYPRPLAPLQPAYSASASDVSGEVTLLLQIDEFGAVKQVAVLSAEPAGYFEDDALLTLQSAHFEPAQREGRPVRSRIVMKVRFAPVVQSEAGR